MLVYCLFRPCFTIVYFVRTVSCVCNMVVKPLFQSFHNLFLILDYIRYTMYAYIINNICVYSSLPLLCIYHLLSLVFVQMMTNNWQLLEMYYHIRGLWSRCHFGPSQYLFQTDVMVVNPDLIKPLHHPHVPGYLVYYCYTSSYTS